MNLNALGLAAMISLAAGGTYVLGDDPAPQPVPAPASVPSPAQPATPPADTTPDTKPVDPIADDKTEDAAPAVPVTPLVLAYTVKDIDGKDVDLSSFKGQVVMIVNVASNCGYTPQYTGLQKLYTDKKDKGFVILGFPANNFGEQEPGSDSEIKSFCTSKYSVTFPMFSKISVKGDDQHPLYRQLALQPKPIGGDPGWNFTKFLIDRTGAVVGRFDSKMRPNDPKLLKQVDELLAEPVPAK